MAQPTIEDGFKFWHDEVNTLENPEKQVAYIPVIGLVAVYEALTEEPEARNSYSWRHAVLRNGDAIDGLRSSLSSFHNDRVDDTFDVPIDLLTPEEHAAAQYRCAYESLVDGMPKIPETVPENEWFLAQQLGYARHDHGVMLDPLRLIEGGKQALKNNYPRTANYISEYA